MFRNIKLEKEAIKVSFSWIVDGAFTDLRTYFLLLVIIIYCSKGVKINYEVAIYFWKLIKLC